jgi:uncharacterized repeat protein (TIGR02543 family)
VEFGSLNDGTYRFRETAAPAGYNASTLILNPPTFTISSADSEGKVIYATNAKLKYTVTYRPGTQGTFPNNVHSNITHGSATPAYSGPTSGGNPAGNAGYTFMGWDPTPVAATVTANATYTAQWTENGTYAVNYDTNGGTPGSITPKTGVKWTDANLLPAQPTKTGYTFAGWNVTAGGSGTNVSNAATYGSLATDDQTPSITLMAQWTEITGYTVYYNTNGGTPGSITPKTGVKWTDANLLPAFDPTRAGYTFAGWNVTTGGSGTNVSNAAAYSVLAANDTTMSITLTAQWMETNSAGYTVFYNTNGGTPAAIPAKTGVKWEDANLLPAQPARVGYDFGGWNVTAGGSGTNVSSAATYGSLAANDTTDSITLTAQWTEKSGYTVNYDTNGGTPAAIPAKTGVKWTDAGLLPAQPTRTDYTFDGWNVTSGGSGMNVTNAYTYGSLAANDQTMSVTLTAQWTPISYTVTFNGNGADVQAVPGSIVVTRPAMTVGALPTPPTRTGYTFDGWDTNRNGTGTIFNGNTPVNADITVYAQWTAIYYQLAFDLNGGGSATPATQSLRAGDLAAAVADPTRSEHAFLGWNTNRNGGGSMWNFPSTRMPARDVTLYAQWRDNGTPVTPDPPATPTPAPGPGPSANPGPSPSPDASPNPGPTPSATPVVPATVTNSPPSAPPPSAPPPDTLGSPTVVESPVDNGPMTQEEALRQIRNAGVPTTTIGNKEVPLYGLDGTPVWALLNLILMIGGMILAVMVPVVALVRQSDYKHNERKRAAAGENGRDDQEETRAIHRPLMMILTIVLGAAGIAAFILTENMNNLMVILDRWTILMAVLFAAGVLATVFTFRRKKDDGDEYDAQEANAGQEEEYYGRHRRLS